jgi:uncharacterized protein (DUF1330 family)
MTVHVIGIFKTQSPKDFDDYRAQVGATIELYGGRVMRRGICEAPFWNQLNAENFDTFVELSFSSLEDAKRWANSPEYLALLPVRERAMQLTLFPVMV